MIVLQAQAATMTIAQAFNLAFESWKDSQEKNKDAITLNGNCIIKKQINADEIKSEESFSNEKSSNSEKGRKDKNWDETSIKEQSPLIDLSSPGDTLDDKTQSAFLVNIEDDETKEMNDEFSKYD